MSYTDSSCLKVIITSFLFPSGKFSLERLQSVLKALDNDTSKLVIDLSCRRKGDTWFVAMNKWQDLTDMELTAGELFCYSFRLFKLFKTHSCPSRYDSVKLYMLTDVFL